MTDTIEGIIFILIGLLAVVGTALNWRLVTRPTKLLNRLLGDMIARIIYVAAGFVLLVLGVGRLIGLNWLAK